MISNINSKFGRNYILLVATENDGPLDLTITPPISIEFDITRNTLSSTNVGQIRIWNLSADHRNQLRFNASDFAHFRRIRLFAGYGKNIPVIFSGNITQAWSERQGVDFITQIECYDGGFAYANGVTNLQFAKGTPLQTVIASIAQSGLPNISLGSIGFYDGATIRSNSYNGNTAQILDDLTGGGFFIDNGKANALQTNEYIASGAGIVTVDAQSGLLGTPKIEGSIARVEMLFEPTLEAGNVVKVTSLTDLNFNGLYKIVGVKHRGMISDAVCGSVITTGEFEYSQALQPVPGFGVG